MQQQKYYTTFGKLKSGDFVERNLFGKILAYIYLYHTDDNVFTIDQSGKQEWHGKVQKIDLENFRTFYYRVT